MITTLSNFQSGKYKLPNAVTAPNGADRTALIQEYIDRYEREVLIDSLGIELFDILAELTYPLEEATEQRLKDLVNGATYTKDNKQVRWEGLSDLLTPYIYYQYVMDQQSELTTFGFERPEGVNSESVSGTPKLTDAFRDFHAKYQGIYNNYPQLIRRSAGIGIDWYGSRSSTVSLYQFLQDNQDVYPEASNFVFKDNINSMGI